MNDRSLAISILQRARDTLGHRLTRRVVDSQSEIAADAEGETYLSEIEAIYEQLGSRLARVNAMLSHLPACCPPLAPDAAASEVVYADLANGYAAGLSLDATPPQTILALPAPDEVDVSRELESVAELLADIAAEVQGGEMSAAGRMISELFDLKPSQSGRWAQALARRMADFPATARRIAQLGEMLADRREHSAAALLAECFDVQAAEAVDLVRALLVRGQPEDSPTSQLFPDG